MKRNNELNEFINNINNSNVNFISRLKDKNRNHIKDWGSDRIATHKMSYAEVDGKYVIYPEVQELKQGTLFDFTDPKYNLNWRNALKSALDRNDYIIAPSEDMAIEYTKNYKNYYPSFKIGGTINNINLTNNNMYVKKRFGVEPIDLFRKGGKPSMKKINRNKKKVSKYQNKLADENISDRKKKRYERKLNKAETKLGNSLFDAIQTGKEALYSQGFREQPTAVINNTHTSFGAPTDPFLLDDIDAKDVIQKNEWNEMARIAARDFINRYSKKEDIAPTPVKKKSRFNLIETPFQKINNDLNEHREQMKKEYPLWLGDNNTTSVAPTIKNQNVGSKERVTTKNTGVVNREAEAMKTGLNRSLDSLRTALNNSRPVVTPTAEQPIGVARHKPSVGIRGVGVVNTEYDRMADALRRNRRF